MAAIAWQGARSPGGLAMASAEQHASEQPLEGINRAISLAGIDGTMQHALWQDPWGALGQESRRHLAAAIAGASEQANAPSSAPSGQGAGKRTRAGYPDGAPGVCTPRIEVGSQCGSPTGSMPMVDPCTQGSVCWQPDIDPAGTRADSPAAP